jgi:dTDP-4-amino-4,6-dideoxygalactose transaminase
MYFTHPQFKFFSLKPFLRRFSENDLKDKLVKIFPDSHIVFTDSGRSAFQIAIRKLELENSEMLVPAYICNIFQPIFEKYNIKPIYLDIDLKTFHINPSEIEKKITPKTKSILICHTYGLPMELNRVAEIAEKYNLKIIEDCAHIPPSTTLGASPLKISGNCAFFSFAKICPNINGGMLVSKAGIKIEISDYKPRLSNIVKFLRLFPVLADISENFRKEKLRAVENFREPQKASKLSLKLFDNYLENFEQKIQKRIELANYFQKKLTELGFELQKAENNTFTHISALVPRNIDRDRLFNNLGRYNIFCLRVWQKPIYPNLPNTSEAARRIINFPLQNWFAGKEITRIFEIIKSIISQNKPG